MWLIAVNPLSHSDVSLGSNLSHEVDAKLHVYRNVFVLAAGYDSRYAAGPGFVFCIFFNGISPIMFYFC